jgi:hypothetical protein
LAVQELIGMVEAAFQWARDNLFATRALLVMVALLSVAAIHDAYEAWRDDLPWFGWDLRRVRRWRFDE